MRSYAVKMFCEPLEAIDQPDPVPVGTEVVIDVTRCGICHSDLHIQDGFYDMGGGKRLNLEDRGVKMPIVMGHEVLGRLVDIGPDAPIDRSEIGRSFLVYPWLGCGSCERCKRDEENACASPNALGVFRPGGYSEKCVIPHPRYLVNVDGIDQTLAATYACSGVTAFSALLKLTIDKEKDNLLIMGLGGVGLSGLQIARAIGFQNVFVADIDPSKRALALENGATMTLDPRHASAIDDCVKSGGIDGAVDFVGAGTTAEFAISALNKGGIYVAVGLFGGDVRLSMPTIVLKSLTIRGSYVGNLKELRDLVALVKSQKVRPMPVETVAFTEINSALDRLRNRGVEGRLVLAR